MGWIEVAVVGVSLSMDAFAAAVCAGLNMRKINYRQTWLIALFFGGFQAFMPALGWLLGRVWEGHVDAVDHYIAFALLAFIGGKMIYDVFHIEDDACAELRLDIKALFMMAIATSIDAFAVGVTFGLNPNMRIVPAALLIGVITFVLSFGGVAIGNIFGARWKAKAQFSGGVMLILVGARILLEGIGF
ncbi:MAG: manganese efflux pump MntP family protein [Christensenellales bacterium]|jgi:putative Mn2+ efflux pump MntP